MTSTSPATEKIGSYDLDADSAAESYEKIIDRFAVLYCLLIPEKSAKDFYEDILKPLSESTSERPANFNFTVSTSHSEQTHRGFMQLLLTGCAHCIAAEIADEKGHTEKAWKQIGNAMYQLGVLEGSVILEPALGHIFSSRSSSGARKRDAKYAPLREFARDLAFKKPYTSRRQAALSIRTEVLAEAHRIGVELSETQAERTITTWLEDMPFGGKRKP